MANTALTIYDLHSILTKAVIKAYEDKMPPSSFFRAFFKTENTRSNSVYFGVRRGTEQLAPQITIGTEGERVTFDNETEKGFRPPMYKLKFEGNEFDRFDDRIFSQSQNFDAKTFGEFATEIANKYQEMRYMIERAKELQAAEAFFNGVVTMKDGANIDYQRKAASIKDNSATPWATVTTDIRSQLDVAANFLSEEGMYAGGIFDLILGPEGWADMQDSNWFKDQANFRRVNQLAIDAPRQNQAGGVFHGTVSGSNALFNVWSYKKGYKTSGGVYTPYWDEDYALVLPAEGNDFVMAHAGIPRIFGTGKGRRIMNVEGEYYLNNYIDERLTAHIFNIASRPLAILRSVDKVYTMKIN